MLFEHHVISLEGFKNSELAFPPSVPCTFFCRRRPAWECDFCICQHLCGACACCPGVFVRSALMARVAFDDTSNVIFVVLALMPLKCKRRAYSHTHTHAYRKYIAFARSVFVSFDFHFFLHGTSRTSSPCSWRYYVFLTLGGLGLTTPTPIPVKLKCWTHFRVTSYFSCPQLSHN